MDCDRMETAGMFAFMNESQCGRMSDNDSESTNVCSIPPKNHCVSLHRPFSLSPFFDIKMIKA